MLKKKIALGLGAVIFLTSSIVLIFMIINQTGFVYQAREEFYRKEVILKRKTFEKNLLYYHEVMQNIMDPVKIADIFVKRSVHVEDITNYFNVGLMSIRFTDNSGKVILSSNDLIDSGKSLSETILFWMNNSVYQPFFFFSNNDVLVGMMRYNNPYSLEQDYGGYIVAEFSAKPFFRDINIPNYFIRIINHKNPILVLGDSENINADMASQLAIQYADSSSNILPPQVGYFLDVVNFGKILYYIGDEFYLPPWISFLALILAVIGLLCFILFIFVSRQTVFYDDYSKMDFDNVESFISPKYENHDTVNQLVHDIEEGITYPREDAFSKIDQAAKFGVISSEIHHNPSIVQAENKVTSIDSESIEVAKPEFDTLEEINELDLDDLLLEFGDSDEIESSFNLEEEQDEIVNPENTIQEKLNSSEEFYSQEDEQEEQNGIVNPENTIQEKLNSSEEFYSQEDEQEEQNGIFNPENTIQEKLNSSEEFYSQEDEQEEQNGIFNPENTIQEKLNSSEEFYSQEDEQEEQNGIFNPENIIQEKLNSSEEFYSQEDEQEEQNGIVNPENTIQEKLNSSEEFYSQEDEQEEQNGIVNPENTIQEKLNSSEEFYSQEDEQVNVFEELIIPKVSEYVDFKDMEIPIQDDANSIHDIFIGQPISEINEDYFEDKQILTVPIVEEEVSEFNDIHEFDDQEVFEDEISLEEFEDNDSNILGIFNNPIVQTFANKLSPLLEKYNITHKVIAELQDGLFVFENRSEFGKDFFIDQDDPLYRDVLVYGNVLSLSGDLLDVSYLDTFLSHDILEQLSEIFVRPIMDNNHKVQGIAILARDKDHSLLTHEEKQKLFLVS